MCAVEGFLYYHLGGGKADVGIKWASLCCDSSSRREEVLLAVGDAIGTVTFWGYIPLFSQSAHLRFTRSQGLRFKSRWRPSKTDSSAVAHLSWSPWVDVPNLHPYNKMSNLAASLNDGSVHLTKILISTTEEGSLSVCDTQSDMTCELFPKQRIPVSKLAWKRRNDDFVLAIARNGSLIFSFHPISQIKAISSKAISSRHENFSPVIGAFLFPTLLI